jgi:hypothetical protein
MSVILEAIHFDIQEIVVTGILVGLVVIGLCCVTLGSIAYRSLESGITPMPSSGRVRRALESLLDELPATGAMAELGSGWGTVARQLARRRPRAWVVGFETSPLPYLFSRLRPCANLKFVRADFFKRDLGCFGLIYCYLCPALMERLAAKFERELEPGSIVVSNSFALRGWRPARVVEVDDFYRSRIYVYVLGFSEPGRS